MSEVCYNCEKEFKGIGYKHTGEFFCAKGCLVKHLRNTNVVVLVVVVVRFLESRIF